MNRQSDNPIKLDSPHSTVSTVFYFGIEVQVLTRLEHCALISYQGRSAIVSSSDLVQAKALQTSA